MVVDPVVAFSRRITLAALLLSLVLLPLAATPGYADDVPSGAQESLAKARAFLAKGDKRSLKKAWARMKKLRAQCVRSIDYWLFHLELTKAMGKDKAGQWADIEASEKANQGCPTFELLRARLEPDLYERQTHLEKAVEVAPKDMRPKLALIDHLLATDEEIEAEELVDELLEANPTHVGLLVRKGRVQLTGGYYNAAVTFVDEQLAKNPLAELFDLKAQAYLAIHREEGKDVLAAAHKASEQAVKLRPDGDFVATLALILERRGMLDKARDTVAKHHEARPSPLLAGLLGQYAFRTGDYARAAKAYAQSAATSERSAKGLVECHIRLGKKKAAVAALAGLAELGGEEAHRYAAFAYARIGKFTEANAHLAKLAEDEHQWTRMWIASTEGKVAKLKPYAEDLLADDGIQGEWFALYVTEALLRSAMGQNAVTGFQNRALRAQADAAAKMLAPDKAPDKAYDLKAKTIGLMRRIPSYYTSVCGTLFRATSQPQSSISMSGETLTFFYAVSGTADCATDSRRIWQFNRVLIQQGAETELLGEGDWAPVKEDYLAGVNHLLAGRHGDAAKSFDAAATGEPYWHRMKLFAAAAKALADPALRKQAGSDALASLLEYPDDLSGRWLALLVAEYAGVDIAAALAEYAKHSETHSDRDPSRL